VKRSTQCERPGPWIGIQNERSTTVVRLRSGSARSSQNAARSEGR